MVHCFTVSLVEVGRDDILSDMADGGAPFSSWLGNLLASNSPRNQPLSNLQLILTPQSMSFTKALETARKRYAERNPKSEAAFAKSVTALPGGGTRTTLTTDPFPLFIDRGDGGTLTDVDGHVYRDL